MQRSSIIATVVAAGGVLIAGSVASVAVINAASTTQPQTQDVRLVADEQPAPEPTATESTSLPAPSAASTSDPEALPPIEAAELPALPTVDDGAQVAPAPVAAAPQAAAPARAAAEPTKSPRPAKSAAQGRPSSKPTAATSSATPEGPAAEISADEAVQLVLKATGGGLAQSVEKDEHNGFKAWAVRLTRHDGSVVTGYVDRSSGVVYDWVVNNEAPAPAANSGGSSGSGDDHEDDDHEDEDHEDHEDGEDDD